MRTKKRGAVVATAAAAAVAVAVPAWAYLTLTSNSDTATLTARSLVAPTSPTATPVSSTSVNLAWSAASQITGAQYVVTNTLDNHVACTVTTTSCTDSAALPGVANTYSAKALLPSSTWASAATTFSSAATPIRFSVTTFGGAPIGTQTAGAQFNVKVTAQKWNGNAIATDSTYTGSKTVVWSGLAASPNGTPPIYPTTTLSFGTGATAGTTTASTLNVTPFAAGAATLTVTEGPRNGSATFTVNAATPELRFTGTSSACGSATTITSLTGKISRDLDIYGNAATFSGTPTVALGPTNRGSYSPTSVSFATGTAKDSGTFTYTATGNGNVTLTATSTGYVAGSCSVKQ
jgi:hypothetical protein